MQKKVLKTIDLLNLEHFLHSSVSGFRKIFLTSKFSSLLFSNPPFKLKLRLQIGGRLGESIGKGLFEYYNHIYLKL
jgi:hypothetical protein